MAGLFAEALGLPQKVVIRDECSRRGGLTAPVNNS